MRVYLAEKPSQANEIATVLGIVRRGAGYLEVKGGDKVTFARGHFYELAEPGEYNPEWGEYWKWAQLPMIPEKFILKPVHGVGEQLKVIKALLKEADTCVIATDAGREGELIAREILSEAKFKGKLLRFWTSALTPSKIAHALANLREGSATQPLFEAARARRNSDFVHGNTLTRAATLAARHRGDYYPVGRVQTPTLALVVRRDQAIKLFEQRGFFELEAKVTTASGQTLTMMHSPDEASRITSKEEAQRILEQAQAATGPLTVETIAAKESAPLPYSMPLLQKEANAAFRFSPKKTLSLAQSLYEKKVTSYPRTDCQYLDDSQKADVEPILVTLQAMFPSEVATLRKMGVTLRDSTFNPAKLTDHHGCIPTGAVARLEGEELQLYTLIAQRFMRAVAPDMHYDQTKVAMSANGVLFKASGRVTTAPGFSAIKLLQSSDAPAED